MTIDTRDPRARLREAHLIIAALVARAGGTLTISPKDLLAVHPRDQVVIVDEPGLAFGRDFTIRLERAPNPDESPPAPPPLVDRDINPDNAVLAERDGDVDAGLGEAAASAVGAAKEEHGGDIPDILGAAARMGWVVPRLPPHDVRPAVVAGVDVGGAEHEGSVADRAAAGKTVPIMPGQLATVAQGLAAAHSRVRELEADLGPLPTHVEKIATAAIRVDGEVWTLPRPARHHVLISAWNLAHWKDGAPGRIGEHEQGFVTSYRRFVDRDEAGRLAFKTGQVDREGLCLTTEDLW